MPPCKAAPATKPTPKPRKPTCNSPPLAHRRNSKAKSPPPADKGNCASAPATCKKPCSGLPHTPPRPPCTNTKPAAPPRSLPTGAAAGKHKAAHCSSMPTLMPPPSPCKPSRWQHLLPKMQTAAPQPQAPPHQPQPSPPSATPALPCKAHWPNCSSMPKRRRSKTAWRYNSRSKAKQAYCPKAGKHNCKPPNCSSLARNKAAPGKPPCKRRCNWHCAKMQTHSAPAATPLKSACAAPYQTPPACKPSPSASCSKATATKSAAKANCTTSPCFGPTPSANAPHTPTCSLATCSYQARGTCNSTSNCTSKPACNAAAAT